MKIYFTGSIDGETYGQQIEISEHELLINGNRYKKEIEHINSQVLDKILDTFIEKITPHDIQKEFIGALCGDINRMRKERLK